MFANLGIRARIIGGFGAIVAFLVVVSVAGFFGLQTLSNVTERYQHTISQAGEISDYLADYNQMVLSLQKYSAAPTAEQAQDARIWIDDVATNDPDGVAKFANFPSAMEEIQKIEISAANLRDTFDTIIILEEQRAGIDAEIASAKSNLETAKSALLDKADLVFTPSTAAAVGRAANETSRVQMLSYQYFQAPSNEAFSSFEQKATATIQQFEKLVQTDRSGRLGDQLTGVRDSLSAYASLVTQSHDLIKSINELTQQDMQVFAQELAVSYEQLTGAVRANQDALGPVAQATAQNATIVVLAVGVLATVLGAVLAFATGNWLTRTISNMSANMERLAKGEFDVDLSDAPQSNELGLMARALETFRSNGLEMRHLDEETEK